MRVERRGKRGREKEKEGERRRGKEREGERRRGKEREGERKLACNMIYRVRTLNLL